MVKQPAAGAMTEDYAIVTRVFDPSTEKTVISVAGIEAYGTLAAGEFVTEPEYVGVALSRGSARLASQERPIRVDHKDHRRHARPATGPGHPRVVTLISVAAAKRRYI